METQLPGEKLLETMRACPSFCPCVLSPHLVPLGHDFLTDFLFLVTQREHIQRHSISIWWYTDLVVQRLNLLGWSCLLSWGGGRVLPSIVVTEGSGPCKWPTGFFPVEVTLARWSTSGSRVPSLLYSETLQSPTWGSRRRSCSPWRNLVYQHWAEQQSSRMSWVTFGVR